jgi:hypothetical protein
VAPDTGLNTTAAADTEVIIEFDNVPAAIVAYFDRAHRYALMTVGAVFFLNTYYFS